MIDQYPKKNLWNCFFRYPVEADTEEDIELLIFNRNMSTKLTKSDVLKKLKKANLTGHGYKKGSFLPVSNESWQYTLFQGKHSFALKP